MSRRSPFQTIVAFSTASLVGTIALFLAGFALNPWEHYVSCSPALHVGVWGRGLDTRLVVFNDAAYGPYRGSIIDLDGGVSSFDRTFRFGDTWGVYYRWFHYRTGETLWTLMISLWYPLLVFAAAPVIWLVRRRRRGENDSNGLRHSQPSAFEL